MYVVFLPLDFLVYGYRHMNIHVITCFVHWVVLVTRDEQMSKG